MQGTYKHILFDWDGTLSHTLPAWFEAHRIVLQEKYNISLSDQDVIEKMLVEPKALKEFNIDKEEYFEHIAKYAEKNFQIIELHNDAVETIEELRRRGKNVCIVTSQWKKFVNITLDFLGFNQLFDHIIANEDVTFLKPHPEPIERALEKLHGKKEETLMIGDSDADICAAYNAGVKSVWFHPPENLQFYPHGHFSHLKPDYTIKSMKELLDIVI